MSEPVSGEVAFFLRRRLRWAVGTGEETDEEGPSGSGSGRGGTDEKEGSGSAQGTDGEEGPRGSARGTDEEEEGPSGSGSTDEEEDEGGPSGSGGGRARGTDAALHFFFEQPKTLNRTGRCYVKCNVNE